MLADGRITRDMTSLYLDNLQIRDITPLKDLTQLRTLSLDGNPISDLTALYRLTNLHTIFFAYNPLITIEELLALQAALPNCYISYADIQECFVCGDVMCPPQRNSNDCWAERR
jgi:internalin A